jgi:hypothetical protein
MEVFFLPEAGDAGSDCPHREIEGLPDRGSAVRGGCVMPVWGAP